MPFQAVIDSTAWPVYCISYNDLKRSVYDILKSDSGSVFPEKEFQEVLQAELDKINLFTVIKYEDIFRSLQSVASSTDIPAAFASDPIKVSEYHLQLEQSIDAISREIVSLDKYVRVNCEGFIRIISKFDKILKSQGTNWFVARLGKEDFCNVNFQSLFILLSLTWSKYRAPVASSADATWRPPESFVRSTAKYWVKPENVARLKATVLKHLPYLIFGSSIKDQERFLDPTSLFEAAASDEETACSQMSETQLVTSIYFDNVDRDVYRDRILRKEGARLVRFRWYGPNEGSPDQEVFVERKVHHESWFDEASSKDRFALKQRDVFRFMKSEFDLSAHFKAVSAEFVKRGKSEKSVTPMRELATEVDTLIWQLSLQPFIRTCYYRCAFQLATSNDVRISLDTQMSLINEFRPNGHPTEPWCRLASDVLAEEDVVRFPYAILEVKLADARNTPKWVNSLLLECGAVRVHKFSKFIHAMAFLHPSRLSMLPHWFGDFEKKQKNISEWKSPKSLATPLTREQRIERVLVSQSSEAEDDISAPNEVKVKDMKSMEPKSIFANERTFLHYCQKGLYLLTVGVGIGMRESGVAASLVQVAIALLTIAYLITVYRQFVTRQNLLLSRQAVRKAEERLNISSGPLLAGGMVLLGSLISFAQNSGLLE